MPSSHIAKARRRLSFSWTILNQRGAPCSPVTRLGEMYAYFPDKIFSFGTKFSATVFSGPLSSRRRTDACEGSFTRTCVRFVGIRCFKVVSAFEPPLPLFRKLLPKATSWNSIRQTVWLILQCDENRKAIAVLSNYGAEISAAAFRSESTFHFSSRAVGNFPIVSDKCLQWDNRRKWLRRTLPNWRLLISSHSDSKPIIRFVSRLGAVL